MPCIAEGSTPGVVVYPHAGILSTAHLLGRGPLVAHTGGAGTGNAGDSAGVAAAGPAAATAATATAAATPGFRRQS
eukprot:gene16086-biopygen20243